MELIKDKKQWYNRRDFLKKLGLGTASLTLSQLIPDSVIAAENHKNSTAGTLVQ